MADLGGLGDKAKDFLNTDKGEQVSDGVLDKAGDAADSASGGKFDNKIDDVQVTVDKKIGN